MTRLKDEPVSRRFLQGRIDLAAMSGFGPARWIEFCLQMLDDGYQVSLYEAKTTRSKYITVRHKHHRRQYRVRFSNHKPNRGREEAGDCDFFVGVAHHQTTTTAEAVIATRTYLEGFS